MKMKSKSYMWGLLKLDGNLLTFEEDDKCHTPFLTHSRKQARQKAREKLSWGGVKTRVIKIGFVGTVKGTFGPLTFLTNR